MVEPVESEPTESMGLPNESVAPYIFVVAGMPVEPIESVDNEAAVEPVESVDNGAAVEPDEPVESVVTGGTVEPTESVVSGAGTVVSVTTGAGTVVESCALAKITRVAKISQDILVQRYLRPECLEKHAFRI